MDKKEFALKAIKPYAKDPTLCGINKSKNKCQYLTKEGKKCVLGQFIIEGHKAQHLHGAAEELLEKYGEDCLIPEARGILTSSEWVALQRIHDRIALNSSEYVIRGRIEELGLFTYEEMMAT